MNTEIDMGKLNDWLESVRNTFINASELASKVGALQVQVNEMTQSLEGLRALNRTLDENLSWSRSERDRLDSALKLVQTELQTAYADIDVSQSNWAQFKLLADERASVIATLKSDNDTIAFRNLVLEEENKTIKTQLDKIADVFKATTTHVASAIQPMSEVVKTVEPFVHPVTGVVQGRDPETKQFVPIKEDGKPGDNKPWWEDQPKESGGGF